ncbi:MAG: helix-turn-helix domain-containing protein [Methyloprofundus sp.]|nr:helix-turn-helix domain-containing protein [Methyloprofundus sp.]
MEIYLLPIQLGFSEMSSFSRAFKRWTGKSPSELRKASYLSPSLII